MQSGRELARAPGHSVSYCLSFSLPAFLTFFSPFFFFRYPSFLRFFLFTLFSSLIFFFYLFLCISFFNFLFLSWCVPWFLPFPFLSFSLFSSFSRSFSIFFPFFFSFYFTLFFVVVVWVRPPEGFFCNEQALYIVYFLKVPLFKRNLFFIFFSLRQCSGRLGCKLGNS